MTSPAEEAVQIEHSSSLALVQKGSHRKKLLRRSTTSFTRTAAAASSTTGSRSSREEKEERARLAALEEAKKVAAAQESKNKSPKEDLKKEDPDPYGDAYENDAEPLEQAMKFVEPLQMHAAQQGPGFCEGCRTRGASSVDVWAVLAIYAAPCRCTRRSRPRSSVWVAGSRGRAPSTSGPSS